MRPPLTTPQSSAISPPNSWTIRLAELLEGAVRSDQEGEYVEPLGSLVADQPSPGPPRGSDRGRALLGFPRPAVDERLAVRSQGAAEPEQAGVGAGGDDAPARPAHVDDAVALDAAIGHLGDLESLAAHRLDGISPELRNPHVAPSFRANLLDQENRLADSTRIQ
jgi:hypothetical protein